MSEVCNQNEPIIAIIVPCYNHGKWMEKCLDSVLTQDYEHKFVVVVDDCSTDDSYEKVLSLLSDKQTAEGYIIGTFKEKLLVYLLQNPTNMKQGYTRNNGIKFAWNKSTHFAILDADDRYLPGVKGVLY